MSMMYSLAYINERVRLDPREFMVECDELFHARVARAADMICENIKISPIVLLSGPSGSGKTTTAKKVEEELERRGINSHTVSMDNYFKTVDLETAPRTADGELDFESPYCLDMELMNEHFSMLSAGEEIRIPYFMFARQKRSASQFTPMKLAENEIAIFEGIHALNDDITNTHPEAFKLFISAASDIMNDGEVYFSGQWMRLARRTVRDSKFRGSDAAYTMKLWTNVLHGEQIHIEPFRHKANLELDSSFPYEVSLMKNYATPLFSALPEGTDRYDELQEIARAFEGFVPLSDEFLSPESLLREFVGGGIY